MLIGFQSIVLQRKIVLENGHPASPGTARIGVKILASKDDKRPGVTNSKNYFKKITGRRVHPNLLQLISNCSRCYKATTAVAYGCKFLGQYYKTFLRL